MTTTNPESSLPPGFRFHPTDEELILHYLKNKATSTPYPVSIIAEVDIYKFDPWDLPGRAMFGDKEWYFFSPRDRKYPKGARPNRSAASGYWKATGTDKPIFTSKGEEDKNIGIKKALVFYMGKPPKGLKTNWIMHEYRLSENPNHKPMKLNDSSFMTMRLDEWVLCRIYKKSNSLPTITISDPEEQAEDPTLMQEADPLPILSNLPINQNTTLMLKPQKSTSFSDLFNAMDYSTLSHLLSDNWPSEQIGSDFSQVLNYGDQNQSISINNFITKNNSNYLIQQNDLPPQIDYRSSVQVVQNQLKRQHPMTTNIDDDEDIFFLHPSKKFSNSCNFINNNNNNTSSTNQLDTNQNQFFLNQQFLNQQLLMNSHHLQF